MTMATRTVPHASPASPSSPSTRIERPRLGFLGVGWIGRHRMEAIAASGIVDVAAVADPSAECVASAKAAAADAAVAGGLDELLGMGLDGIVIATPSALHAEQAVRCLESGVAVFCQKPLGRTGDEVRRVVAAARAADRPLGVDLSYRETAAAVAIRERVRAGSIGTVFAADLVFHNAYGPDKAWFYDPALAGGGCVMDLGVHLVDLALWTLDFPPVESVRGRLFAAGAPLGDPSKWVEDYAVAEIGLEGGAVVRIACSWRLHAGRDAVISAAFHGTAGGAEMRNVGGSFYDFAAEAHRGTSRETIASPPDAWGGRAAVRWAERLAAGDGFHGEEGERLIAVADVLDRIYDR